jgi:hypothetical protein
MFFVPASTLRDAMIVLRERKNPVSSVQDQRKARSLRTSSRTTEQPGQHPRKAAGPYAGHDPDYSGMVVSSQKGPVGCKTYRRCAIANRVDFLPQFDVPTVSNLLSAP